MCGIIAAAGEQAVAPVLIHSLKRRDFVRIAAVFDGRIERRLAKGKIRELETVPAAPWRPDLLCNVGINPATSPSR